MISPGFATVAGAIRNCGAEPGTSHTQQPADHVRDVRAEDAPVDVRLVDDHVG